MKIQEKYLWELVSISGYDRTQSSPMLRIYACGQSAEQAQLLLDNLLSKLDELQPKVAESTVPHKTGLIYGGINTTVSADLARHQEAEKDRLEEYQAELEKLMLPANTPSAPAAPENPLKGAVKDAIIFAVLGGAAGVFLVAAAACISYLLGDKVYSGEDIRSRSGIRLLGKVALRPSKKNPIDRWLDRMENRPVFDDKAAFTMLAAAIANYSADARPVMITGNASDELLQKFADLLRAALPDLPIVSCGGLLSSVDAVKQLPSCGSVLLVECCRHSRYSAVAKQMDIAAGMDKLILGVVALEA